MAYQARITAASSFRPAPLAEGVLPADYALDAAYSLVGDTDTIVQAVITPEDFSGGGSEPELEIDLGTGGSTSALVITPTPSVPGGETVDAVVRQWAGGTGNDFSRLRAIHLRAVPVDPDTASSCQILATFGDLAAGAWERAAIPLGFDSAATDRTAASEALLILPLGHTYSSSHPLNLIIYQAANVQIIASFLGK